MPMRTLYDIAVEVVSCSSSDSFLVSCLGSSTCNIFLILLVVVLMVVTVAVVVVVVAAFLFLYW